MRIAIFNKFLHFSGGPERYLTNLYEGLVARGHDVAVAGIDHGLRIEVPGVACTLPSKMGPGEWRMSATDRPGLAALPRAIRLAVSSAFDRQIYEASLAFLQHFRPDVTLTLNYSTHLTPSPLVASADLGIPRFVRLSDYSFVCGANTFYRDGQLCFQCRRSAIPSIVHACVAGSRAASAVRAAAISLESTMGWLKAVDGIICPSQFMADEIVRYGAAASRVHVIPTPVGSPANPPQPRVNRHSVVYVGRLAPEKGVDTLLHAARLIPEVPFEIVGSGHPDYVAALARAAPANVAFRGHLAGPALAEVMSLAFCSVLLARWPENSPNALLECGAAGLPVIVSDAPTLTETVTDGISGKVVPIDDAEAAATAIRELHADPAFAERLGAALRAYVESVHAMDRHLDAVLRLFGSDGRSR